MRSWKMVILTLLVAGGVTRGAVAGEETSSPAAGQPVSGGAAAMPVPDWRLSDRGGKITDEGRQAGFFALMALYPLNRVMDLMDVTTFQFGFGFGLHVNGHATRAAQVGAGLSAVSRLGFDRRCVGLDTETKAEFSLLPFSAERYKRQNSFGAFRDYRGRVDAPWLYQVHRDYWAGGAEVTAAIVNVGAEVHLVEAIDFLLGVFAIDPLHDDVPLRWSGQMRPLLPEEKRKAIKRIVAVSSRVVKEKTARMAQDGGIGVYYYRSGDEALWGKVGTLFGYGNDRDVAKELSSYMARKGLDIHRELLERVERSLVVKEGWDVINVHEPMQDFGKYSVIKSYKGQKIRRLPNYPGLCHWYGADAVLDVRVWEWGIWRERLTGLASMRLDCEFKLIDKTGKEVLFDARELSYQGERAGKNLLEYAKNEGDTVIEESKLACDIVQSKFMDHLAKSK